MKFSIIAAAGLFAVSTLLPGSAAAMQAAGDIQPTTNSAGLSMVPIPAGSFSMGQPLGETWHAGGEWDEVPVHQVTLSKGFSISATEVTNAQYERFDPAHRAQRGERGFSLADDEPVIFISWDEANAFCAWLSQKEGRPYRLPTEAEWEYACRAGSVTPYSTGAELPAAYWRAQVGYEDKGHNERHQTTVSLRVAQTQPNAWGLYDMHGNVEEWCQDWYGPYAEGPQVDPVGRASGDARVTRGGSHNTDVYFLRSANRLGAIPSDRSWLIGFRVVQAPAPATQPLPRTETLVTQHVSQEIPPHLAQGPDPAVPYFSEPQPYVNLKDSQFGPIFSFHNHDPALIDCPNGDLLAIWYATQREWGRELVVLGSRLRYGAAAWDPASLFFTIPDRNDHAPALWRDADGTLYHFNGTGASGWEELAIAMRTSADNGATWTPARIIQPNRGRANGCVESVIQTNAGRLIVPLDSGSGTEPLVSDDQAATFFFPSDCLKAPSFKAGATGCRIAGIHAALVELLDGRLYSIGRGKDIDGFSALSISADQGRTWSYQASALPPLGVGQRPVLRRLAEGPLLYVAFTDRVKKMDDFQLGVQRGRTLRTDGMLFPDAAGGQRRGYGMFAALSYDDGKTWPVMKLLTPGGKPREWFGQGWTKQFTTDATHAEPLGYLASTQTADGVIHVVSSGIHYAFNTAWLNQPMPAE